MCYPGQSRPANPPAREQDGRTPRQPVQPDRQPHAGTHGDAAARCLEVAEVAPHPAMLVPLRETRARTAGYAEHVHHAPAVCEGNRRARLARAAAQGEVLDVAPSASVEPADATEQPAPPPETP